MDEFNLIARYFAPLAKNFPGARGLKDDAAILAVPEGFELVVTKDAISAGIHFIGDEPPALIARKLLRVNLSDLAAMGATPYCYFLALMLPPSLSFPRKRESISHNKMDPRVKPEDDMGLWLADFAAGLAEDQKTFGIHLAGGDTTATASGLSFSLTALGLAPKGIALPRGGARPGDDVYVSGTIGDGALGLLSLQGGITKNEWLEQRYLLPQPRTELGEALRGIATSCIDISDGLLQDMGHICAASNVDATLHRPLLPLSKPAAALVGSDPTLWENILGGGDDYELLFTAPPEKASRLAALPVTKIGAMALGSGVRILDENGSAITPQKKGFTHF
jgi:thiamine-monophosphate kinase